MRHAWKKTIGDVPESRTPSARAVGKSQALIALRGVSDGQRVARGDEQLMGSAWGRLTSSAKVATRSPNATPLHDVVSSGERVTETAFARAV